MDVQAQESLKAVKLTTEVPRKVVTQSNARFLNPDTPTTTLQSSLAIGGIDS